MDNIKNKIFTLKAYYNFKEIRNFENLISLISGLFFLSYYFAIALINDGDGKEAISFDFSVVITSFLTILFLPFITKKLGMIPSNLFYENSNSKEVKFKYLFISFIFFSLYLNHFSWDGSTTIFHSFSAYLRLIWLFYATQINSKTPRSYIFVYLIMSLFLGFIDTKRTYLLMYLLIVFFQLRLSILPSLFLLFMMILSLSLIASIRNGQPADIFQSIIYSFAGETYLATLSYEAAYNNIDFSFLENLYHLFYLFFSPILILINKFLCYLPFNSCADHPIIQDLFQLRYGQFNIMGGHFISSTFLSFKSFQFIIQPVYFIFTYAITKRLIGPLSISLSSILFIICLKATPYTYWNLVLVILIIGILLKFIRRIKFI